jgi:RimJ/RimL family protein N-acetyltransferase
MNRDHDVMRYFVRHLEQAESDALINRIEAQFEERGFGLWVVERLDDTAFLGFAGLLVPTFDAPFTPCVEVGWRLEHRAWGSGYATEAATEALRFGFEEANLDEIVSFAPLLNARSIRVMERLDMTHDPHDDFDHPLLPEGHPLRRHVLYRIRPEEFRGPG